MDVCFASCYVAASESTDFCLLSIKAPWEISRKSARGSKCAPLLVLVHYRGHLQLDTRCIHGLLRVTNFMNRSRLMRNSSELLLWDRSFSVRSTVLLFKYGSVKFCFFSNGCFDIANGAKPPSISTSLYYWVTIEKLFVCRSVQFSELDRLSLAQK